MGLTQSVGLRLWENKNYKEMRQAEFAVYTQVIEYLWRFLSSRVIIL